MKSEIRSSEREEDETKRKEREEERRGREEEGIQMNRNPKRKRETRETHRNVDRNMLIARCVEV